TTAQLAAALTPTGEYAPAPTLIETSERTVGLPDGKITRDPENERRRRRRLALGATAAVVLIAAIVLARWFLPKPRVPHKDWILLADFDGPAADSAIVSATRDLVMAALDQSAIVATVPRDQVLLALRSAEKPTSMRVDAELARELATRSGVQTVLTGKVGRL